MWQLADRTHPVLTDEGGAILNERTGRWTQLTPTASAAVLLLLACTTAEEAAARYAERYAIPTSQAAADVRVVTDTLTSQGLARTESARPRRWRRWTR